MRGLLFPLVTLFAVTVVSSSVAVAEPIVVGSPEVLPLALDDAFRVVKVFTQTVDPEKNAKVKVPVLKAEVDRRYFGAINAFEKRQREGNYYTVQWKAPKGADVTVRLEYRQQKLGAYVQALDSHYSASSTSSKASSGGTMNTEFSILGDDYYQDGAVVAWRVLLIQSGRIVGVQQSFLW